jgi:SpoVK/Ycf46/Vps4 family AAA+-type ATPase
MAKFRIGDRVHFDWNEDGDDLGTIRGSRNGHIEWSVAWDDEPREIDWVDADDLVKDRTASNVDVASKPEGAVKNTTKVSDDELNKKELDRLIIEDEKREEIEAVLKQHKFADKIFEEWGLGETIEYGKGMTMLFWGPPGTGKTWGATCISKALGKELQVVNPSMIQSSEPGGANRAIEAAFAEAKESDKVLFFDECDGLICNRENVGMIIGSEINTLLTCIEQFEGVCILCTNMIGSLDKALERRISLIIEFAEPNEEARTLIWGKMLPSKMPLEKGVTPKSLAKTELTGGQIKNVILGAARKAVATNSAKVMKEHFASAITNTTKNSGLMGKPHNPWANAGPESGAGTSSRSRAAGSTDKVRKGFKDIIKVIS